jgi:hypothetical protein
MRHQAVAPNQYASRPAFTRAQQAAPLVVAQPPVAAVQEVIDESSLAPQFKLMKTQGIEGRVAFWSEFLTHSKEAAQALATIQNVPKISDSAPLVPSKFDCTTFVETVAALSRSESSRDFYPNLLAIRYRGSQPDYLARNHFPEADWIPNNQSAGILSDTTQVLADAAKVDREVAHKRIDRTRWLAKQQGTGASRGLASFAEPLRASVPFVPLKSVEALSSKIPSGAILNIVRHDRENKPVLITHQGFVIQQDGKTMFRHASVGGAIKTVPLMQYLRDLEEKAREKNWPLAGVNVNQLKR